MGTGYIIGDLGTPFGADGIRPYSSRMVSDTTVAMVFAYMVVMIFANMDLNLGTGYIIGDLGTPLGRMISAPTAYG